MKSQVNKDIKLKKYNIYFRLDDEEDRFDGYEEIFLDVQKDDVPITLDMKELKIEKVFINKKEANYAVDETEDKIAIENGLKGEKYIQIYFSGKVSTNMAGFYLSKYSVDGVEKKLYSTQFESIYARRAFPCFDQPNMKAYFNITITANKKYTILGNTEPTELNEEILTHIDKDNADMKSVTFEESPKMSSYLLAFVIGELNMISRNRTEVYTPFNVEDAKFALEVADDSLIFFEEYFKIPFPLKKLKHVAVPEFAVGAMENWGLITYRDSSFLFGSKSTFQAKINIANTIAHENSHQWFGNLATMEWWDDLWLNEAFATWAADHCLQNLLKMEKYQSGEFSIKHNIKSGFIIDDVIRGLDADQLSNSHPIHVPVDKPEEIEQIFGPIVYSKGASLMRMIENYLGEKTFREKISHYLTEFSYKNATRNDLFAFLGPNIQNILDNWINKMGYPLLEITDEEENIHIKQRNHNIKNEKLTWKIPIKVLWVELEKSEYYLMEEEEFEIKKLSPTYIVNDEKYGFYRTDQNILYENGISTDNIISNIDDKFALLRSHNITIEMFLPKNIMNNKTLLKKSQNDYYLLQTILSIFNEFRNIFVEKRHIFENLLMEFIDEINFDYTEVKESDEMNLRALKLSTYISLVNDMNILSHIYNRLDVDDLHPVYLPSKYKTFMKLKNDKDVLLRVYKNGEVGERLAALQAIGFATDEGVYNSVINELVLNNIGLQDKIRVCFSLLANIAFKKNLCTYFKENFEEINKAFNNNTILLSYLVEHIIANCDRVDIEIFAKVKGISRAVTVGNEKRLLRGEIFAKNNDFIAE